MVRAIRIAAGSVVSLGAELVCVTCTDDFERLSTSVEAIQCAQVVWVAPRLGRLVFAVIGIIEARDEAPQFVADLVLVTLSLDANDISASIVVVDGVRIVRVAGFIVAVVDAVFEIAFAGNERPLLHAELPRVALFVDPEQLTASIVVVDGVGIVGVAGLVVTVVDAIVEVALAGNERPLLHTKFSCVALLVDFERLVTLVVEVDRVRIVGVAGFVIVPLTTGGVFDAGGLCWERGILPAHGAWLTGFERVEELIALVDAVDGARVIWVAGCSRDGLTARRAGLGETPWCEGQ